MTTLYSCLVCGDDMDELSGPQVCAKCAAGPSADSLVTLVYDNETGTVLAAEDCSVITCTYAESEQLCDGALDLETWQPVASYPVLLRDAHIPTDSAFIEVNYSDGSSARWCVSNATGDRVVNMLGTPDTLKC